VAYLVTRPRVDDEERPFWTHPISRSWDAAAPGELEVLAFANGDELSLSCGGEPIPLERDDEHGWWSAVTGPRDEPLVLESWRDGRVVARDELRARGEAVAIAAAVWKPRADVADACRRAGIDLDGVVQIECVLRDATGGVACDDRVIEVAVEGGELLGIENGDLADDTPYDSAARRTLDGRLVVFVRARQGASVRLSSPGLDGALVVQGA
jgi:beta-galactosidase